MQKILFFIWVVVFVLLASWTDPLYADADKCPVDRIILGSQLSILEDPSRSLTIEQVNHPHYAQQFKVNSDARTNFGMSHSAFWFRIDPMLTQGCTQDWLLAVRWTMLDNIEFFWFEKAQWRRIVTGARHPYASRQIDFQTYMFRLPDLSTQYVPYYLRVLADNPLFMGMRLLLKQRYEHNMQRRMMLHGIYLGVLSGLVLYSVGVFLSLRDTTYLYYVIYLICTILLVAQYTGIATRYLWPESPDWNVLAFWFFIIAGTTAYLAFIGKFLDTKKNTPRLNRAIDWFSILLLLALAGFYGIDHVSMIAAVPFLALTGFILSGIAVVIALYNGFRPARFVAIANLLYIAGMIWVSLLMFGYPFKLLEWNYFLFMLVLAIEATLLSLALASRIKLLHREKLMAQQALVDSKRHFSDQLIAAQDMERKRIASELHDGIGQNLMVVNNRIKRVLKEDLPTNVVKKLAFAVTMTQQTINDLRELSHLLHPHQLDRLGLLVAIETMAHDTLSSAGIKVNCQIDAIDHFVKKEQALHIYRIVQESVNNIVRHSEAAEATIVLRGDRQAVYLSIHDNGQGIKAMWFRRKDFSRAFGLSSIRERVHLMSGKLAIYNATPNGLILAIKIPL